MDWRTRADLSAIRSRLSEIASCFHSHASRSVEMAGAVETFGERLARLRCDRKPTRQVGTKGGEWTQAWLARELGLGQSLTVWLWENDRRIPDATMMARLATLLGCSEHYLRYGTEEPRVQTLEALQKAMREGQTLEFLRAIAGVP